MYATLKFYYDKMYNFNLLILEKYLHKNKNKIMKNKQQFLSVNSFPLHHKKASV